MGLLAAVALASAFPYGSGDFAGHFGCQERLKPGREKSRERGSNRSHAPQFHLP
jgi:hypothetical protein